MTWTQSTAHLRTVLQPGVRMAHASLDRLADAIVSIEYYMETLQSGRADPWYMLDNAESALDAVDAGPAPCAARRAAGYAGGLRAHTAHRSAAAAGVLPPRIR